MTDSGATFQHDKGRNYEDVTLSIVSPDERNIIVLKLNKALDVSDVVTKKIEKIHKAMELVCEGISDEWITVNSD